MLPGRYGARTLASFVRGLLRIDPTEAAGRVRAARTLGTRHNPVRFAFVRVAIARG